MVYTLSPFIKYFGVLGLVPWAEEPSRQLAQKLYTFAIVLVHIFSYILAMSAPPKDLDLPVSQLVSDIVFTAHMVTMSVILLQAMFQYEEFSDFCMELKSLNLRFQCQVKVPANSLPRMRSLKLLFLGAVSILTLIPGIYIGIITNNFVGYFLYSIGSVLINRCQTVLLLINAELLTFHAELLCQQLQQILRCRQLRSTCILEGDCHRLSSIELLLSLKQVYTQLYGLYIRFNALYGWSMLFIFVVLFLDSTVNIYWTLLALTEAYSYVYIGISCASFTPQLVLIFALCSSGEFCKRQHELIGSQIRGVSCVLQVQKQPVHQGYNALVVEFSMQVEQDPLVINAEGFMDIDYGLLMSIFTAMVTYLIVLMQFGSF
ncbi:putative gustatory receptor 39b [Drosophila tropicalis]|uniref:putative gustatory receptor 39b n=1 Tax=Drosophila tropicalis TaxID=46794 RepID=UPI0035AB8AA3